jgi:hypothetical protein
MFTLHGFRFPKWATQSERRASKPRQHKLARRGSYHRRLLCEALEDRRLLTSGALTLVAGDNLGNVTVMDGTTGNTIATRNLDGASIGNITVADVANSGTPQVLVTHSAGVTGLPTYSLSLASLATFWHTTTLTGAVAPTAVSRFTAEPQSLFTGDFQSDGTTDVVVPYLTAANSGECPPLGVFSGVTGKQLYAITQSGISSSFSVYQDPANGWRMVTDDSPDGLWTHYMDCYNLNNGALVPPGSDVYWPATNVNTAWVGSVGASLIDGRPREWGSWYGQTVYVLDGNGKLLWSKSYGSGYEAHPLYAGDLTVGGSESLVVGESTLDDYPSQIMAVNLADGSISWTYTDPFNPGEDAPLACVDTNGTGVKQVFVWSGPVGSAPNRLLALNGSNGSLLWSTTFSNPKGLAPIVRFADINGDGKLDLLMNVNNTVEAFDGVTGSLQKTWTLSGTVTSFDVTTRATLATTTAVPASPKTSVLGQNVTFTAAVSANNANLGEPTGTVTFEDGNTTLGTGTLDASGHATFNTRTLSLGSHTITASYSGDDNFTTSSGNVTETVEQDATTTAVKALATLSGLGQSEKFTATVTAKAPGSGTPGGIVTFKDGLTTLGTGTLDANGTATF